MTIQIRTATRADAHAIATIRVRTWRKAYDGLIDDDVLAAMDISREAEARAAGWDRWHGENAFVDILAFEDGDPVGWASFGPSRDEDLPDGGELYAIYALPSRWSTGIGRSLMAEVERRLRDLGFPRAHLWVLDGNDRAAAFYERHGWLEDGTTKTETGLVGRPLFERRRVRELSGVAPD